MRQAPAASDPLQFVRTGGLRWQVETIFRLDALRFLNLTYEPLV
jgi:hypothetical protein